MTQDVPLDQLVPSESKYLSKEDVGEQGMNLTIAGFSITKVGQGADADDRCILHFNEGNVKPMVVNKTNMARIKHVTGAETTGQARGKAINVYHDPMVEYGGKLVGGLRIRAAANQVPENTYTNPVPDDGDDIPF